MTTSLPVPQSSPQIQAVQYVWNLPPRVMGAVIGASLLSLSAIAGSVYLRYGNSNLTQIPLKTQTVTGSNRVGENISFYPAQDSLYHIQFEISHKGKSIPIQLQNIDIKLMIPQIPDIIRGNPELTQWFLTEREFNQQQVIFPAGSPEINIPHRFMGYRSEDISIALTNSALGAGFWELAIFAQTPEGEQQIYQGSFNFPKGAYSRLVSQLNNISYWHYAPSLENWPGFEFYRGMPFNLEALRTVKRQYLIHTQDRISTTDYPQISQLQSASAKTIQSPLADEELLELELIFKSESGKIRKLIVSGLDWHNIPQLSIDDYDRGLYIPLGFAPPFKQNYEQLKQNPPQKSPVFSVMLDGYNLVMNYRQDIGINGFAIHRDLQNPHKLHFYLMSDEQMTWVSHSVLDLTQWVLIEHPEPEAMSAVKTFAPLPSMALSKLNLNQKVYTQLDQAWQTNPPFNQQLTYRIFVNSEGVISGYSPGSPEAENWVNYTPLSDLDSVSDAKEQGLDSFRVVFTPRGGIEVSPWWGWNE